MKRRRKNLPFWAILTIWLVMSTGFAAYNWFLVRQDEAIAPREQVALGTMYKLSHGKSTTASYSFEYSGKTYRGSETVSSNHCFCDVPVYFDPDHPSTNTLVEYRRKINLDHGMMVACSYVSVGLAIILGCVVWALRKSEQPSGIDSVHIS
jgi:hypothetical protein